MSRWRTLLLATAGFNLSFLIWFSFAPFLDPISSEFGLSFGQAGVLASAAFWIAPVGRVIAGWLSDRHGAPIVFGFLLVGVGLASVASAFVDSYVLFFALRLLVGTAGVTFVVGIQHVAQWFPAEEVGTAEGIYAGIGNAGAGLGALALPWLFGADWRTAFVVTGVAAVVLGVVYAVVGEDAATTVAAEEAADGATVQSLLHVGTRYGVLVLALAYLMSFGLVLSLNSWLPTYFDEGFDSGLAVAGLFAGSFGIASGALRPIGGYVSDLLVRRERNLLPVLRGRYREQWTLVCLVAIVVLLGALTVAGHSGSVYSVVAVGVLLGTACGWAGGAIFAQVPALFPERTGAVAGVVGGIGTFGGVAYSLALSTLAGVGVLHDGYALVGLSMVPIVVLAAYMFRPSAVERGTVEGFVYDAEEIDQPAAVADD